MLGAVAAAGVVDTLFPGPLAATTTLSGNTNKAQSVFIEMFLTAQLVFTVFMLAAEKHKGTFLAPVGIGWSLFIAELADTCAQAIEPTRVRISTTLRPVRITQRLISRGQSLVQMQKLLESTHGRKTRRSQLVPLEKEHILQTIPEFSATHPPGQTENEFD
jgi:hypothetical protein